MEHDEGSLLHIGEAIWSDSRETGGKFTMSVVYIVHMVGLIITSSHPDLSPRFMHNQVFFPFKLRSPFYCEFQTLLYSRATGVIYS